jgi:hypothetical protein
LATCPYGKSRIGPPGERRDAAGISRKVQMKKPNKLSRLQVSKPSHSLTVFLHNQTERAADLAIGNKAWVQAASRRFGVTELLIHVRFVASDQL